MKQRFLRSPHTERAPRDPAYSRPNQVAALKYAAEQSSPNIALEGEGRRSGDVDGGGLEEKVAEEMKVKKVTQDECD